jgi:hypothetical protein
MILIISLLGDNAMLYKNIKLISYTLIVFTNILFAHQEFWTVYNNEVISDITTAWGPDILSWSASERTSIPLDISNLSTFSFPSLDLDPSTTKGQITDSGKTWHDVSCNTIGFVTTTININKSITKE